MKTRLGPSELTGVNPAVPSSNASRRRTHVWVASGLGLFASKWHGVPPSRGYTTDCCIDIVYNIYSIIYIIMIYV